VIPDVISQEINTVWGCPVGVDAFDKSNNCTGVDLSVLDVYIMIHLYIYLFLLRRK
jgi:hypothetical protein